MKKFRTEKIKEYDKMVARRLAAIRIASGLKQSDIGKLLEMDRTNYSYIESGKNAIKLYYLMKLCNFYDISMDVITMADDQSFFSFLDKGLHQIRRKRFWKINFSLNLTQKPCNTTVLLHFCISPMKKFLSYKTATHLKKRYFYDRMPLKSEGILTYIELFEGVMAGK